MLKQEASWPWGRPGGKSLGRNVQLSSSLHEAEVQDLPAGFQGGFRWDDALWSQPGTFLGARGRGLRKTDMASTPDSITNQWETSRKRLIISTALL